MEMNKSLLIKSGLSLLAALIIGAAIYTWGYTNGNGRSYVEGYKDGWDVMFDSTITILHGSVCNKFHLIYFESYDQGVRRKTEYYNQPDSFKYYRRIDSLYFMSELNELKYSLKQLKKQKS